MYIAIYRNGNLIKRIKEIIGTLSFDNELMYAPHAQIMLPISYLEYFNGREEVKIFVNNKCFWGIVWDIIINKVDETITLDIRHVITEWQYRQISVNHAISNTQLNVVYKGDEVEKDSALDEAITASGFTLSIETAKKITKSQLISSARASAWVISNGDKLGVIVSKIEKKGSGDEYTAVTEMDSAGDYRITFATQKGTSVQVNVDVQDKYEPEYDEAGDPSVIDNLKDIYEDSNFAYPGWQVEIEDGANEVIDYVYSRQNKLEALTQTMELTDDLFWRVGFRNEKVVEIGRFGEIKPYIISMKPSGETNIRMIEEPEIDYDFENVVNVATVYSDKSDSGMSSLTLREVYMNPQYQKEGFPVVILHANVNNERDYSMYISQYPKLAPNNEIEYAVLDEASIALESGTLIEGTYAFNDMSPFELNGKRVSDAKRISAARTVYERVIKQLIQSRRSYDITVMTEEIPADLNVGDRVRVLYDNRIWEIAECSSYWKKLVAMDDYYYITRIEYEIDENGVEFNRLTLSKWIKIERETNNYD